MCSVACGVGTYESLRTALTTLTFPPSLASAFLSLTISYPLLALHYCQLALLTGGHSWVGDGLTISPSPLPPPHLSLVTSPSSPLPPPHLSLPLTSPPHLSLPLTSPSPSPLPPPHLSLVTSPSSPLPPPHLSLPLTSPPHLSLPLTSPFLSPLPLTSPSSPLPLISRYCLFWSSTLTPQLPVTSSYITACCHW